MSKNRLGETLIAQGKILPEQLKQALETQKFTGEKLGELLVREGLIVTADWLAAVAENNPSALYGMPVRQDEVPVDELIKTKTAILAFTKHEAHIATLSRFKDVAPIIAKYIPEKKIVPVEGVELFDLQKLLAEQRATKTFYINFATETNPKAILYEILRKAVETNASDAHFESNDEFLKVKLRNDGQLKTFVEMKNHGGRFCNAVFTVIKGHARLDISQRKRPQSGSFSMTIDGRIVDFRVETFPKHRGQEGVIRVLDKEKGLRHPNTLGYPRVIEKRIFEISKMPHGLFLVCGPTGSGKTTTLNALIKFGREHEYRKIISFEEPVEYDLDGLVTQIEINSAVSWADALKSALRSDPDMLVVSEVRDASVGKPCIDAAMTGHFVFASLHANDVYSAVERFIGFLVHHDNMDRENAILIMRTILRGIVIQRLVRKVCIYCKGSGCEECKQTGFKGRTVVCSFVDFTLPGAFDKILASLNDTEKPFWTFEQDALRLVDEGITTKEEISRVVIQTTEDANAAYTDQPEAAEEISDEETDNAPREGATDAQKAKNDRKAGEERKAPEAGDLEDSDMGKNDFIMVRDGKPVSEADEEISGDAPEDEDVAKYRAMTGRSADAATETTEATEPEEEDGAATGDVIHEDETEEIPEPTYNVASKVQETTEAGQDQDKADDGRANEPDAEDLAAAEDETGELLTHFAEMNLEGLLREKEAIGEKRKKHLVTIRRAERLRERVRITLEKSEKRARLAGEELAKIASREMVLNDFLALKHEATAASSGDGGTAPAAVKGNGNNGNGNVPPERIEALEKQVAGMSKQLEMIFQAVQGKAPSKNNGEELGM